MVKLTKIYTRGGDKGRTSLGDGSRVAKHDLRVEAYGTVDEANAALGLARLYAEGEAEAMLARIQHDLFDLGADLCRPEAEPEAATAKKKGAAKTANAARKPAPLRIVEAQVARLEREIDRMNAALQPLESFVLPGGSAAAAHLHLARTTARRAERLMTALAEKNPINPIAIKYINRLSDHLFVLARYLNDRGKADILWRPGANR
ncbi:MAG TPA: cob(I)yrinic acid a,c-diamide adenosyltransferase [Dongiaceae bacterium]|jgi:cob(I)alamin adenosyltransferase|nr:cob(I)yrinic acid a,c-diamide adenosyltransferase [Dongiaceae bacterium]